MTAGKYPVANNKIRVNVEINDLTFNLSKLLQLNKMLSFINNLFYSLQLSQLTRIKKTMHSSMHVLKS